MPNVITTKIDQTLLKKLTEYFFVDMVKYVVDIEKEILAIDAELHSDEEESLLKGGSKQNNLWGINLYPELSGDDFIEFDSMINIRPRQNNRSRSVENTELQKRIRDIVSLLIT